MAKQKEMSLGAKVLVGFIALGAIGSVFTDEAEKNVSTNTIDEQEEVVIDENDEEIEEYIEEEKELNDYVKLTNSAYYMSESEYKEGDLATVTKINSGDSIQVELNGQLTSVRLLGLDAPGVVNTTEPVDCFGGVTSGHAIDQLQGKQVYLIADDTQKDKDQYDRLLRYVVLPDGYVYNLNLVLDGYSKVYDTSPNSELEIFFNRAEDFAKDHDLGIWGNSCACEADHNKEVSRNCTACNQVTIKIKQWDCSEKTSVLEDSSCSSLCPPPVVYTPPTYNYSPPTTSYVCNCSKTCPNMSCSEAQYQLNVCGCGARDADNDGVACDAQCQ